MQDRKKEQDKSSVPKKFRSLMEESRLQEAGKDISGHSGNEAARACENKGIVEKAIAGISGESLVQGLIYSELFGRPLCKRRGR